MTAFLALLEAGSIFAVVCAVALGRFAPAPIGRADLAVAAARSLAVSLCCVAAFYYNDLYDLRVLRNAAGFATRLPRALATALALLCGIYVLIPAARMGAAPFLASLFLVALTFLVLRAASRVVIRSRAYKERVLILGTSPMAEKLVREIEARRDARHRVVGVVADTAPPGTKPFRYPVLAPFGHLGRILEGARPDRVVVAMRERRGRLAVEHLLEARLRGVRVEDGHEFYERITGKIAIESLTPSGLIFSDGFGRTALSRSLGHAMSLLAALAGLILLAPLLGVIALAIAIDSGGPVIFSQDRVGRGGRTFRLLKFRTMRPAGTHRSEWARDNDHRVTRVGRWLRKFRLDELPQFVNILRGEMNLVGPRPHPASNYDLFLATVPYYSLRAAVRPGVTGWAQVRYRYANNLEEETEKMRYDLYYIKRQSIAMDLGILLDTLKIILLGRGPAAAHAGGTESPAGGRALPIPLRAREE